MSPRDKAHVPFLIGDRLLGIIEGRNATEAKAGARLVAAAPDLLAALEGIRALVEETVTRHPGIDWAVHPIEYLADAAIAKARGEEVER